MSWFYLQTFKNAFKKQRFAADLSAKTNADNPGKEARVYAYKAVLGDNYTLAVWSPTQENIAIHGYALYLPENTPATTTSAEIRVFHPFSEIGITYQLPVHWDGERLQYFIVFDAANPVTETPVFVTPGKGIEAIMSCSPIAVAAIYPDAVQLEAEFDLGYDAAYRIFYAEGDHPDIHSGKYREYQTKIRSSSRLAYIGGLKSNTTYTFYAVPAMDGEIPADICSVTATTGTGTPCFISVDPSFLSAVHPGEALGLFAPKLFDEPAVGMN